MNNTTVYRLIGTDDDNALYQCSYCNNVIPIEMDTDGSIDISDLDDTCPECGALILRIDLD